MPERNHTRKNSSNWKFLCGIAEGGIRFVKCVVPENIQTPTTEGIGNSREVGGSEAREIPEGRGVGP